MSKLEIKNHVRNEISEKRKGMDFQDILAKSDRICDYILDSREYMNANTLMLYRAIGNEVRLDKLIKEALNSNKNVVFPVCSADRKIEAYIIDSIEDFKSGKLGILEPDKMICKSIEPERINLIAIPGVSFDYKLNRMGRGAGYYDIFLPSAVNAFRLGVCFKIQIVDNLPVDEFDVPMDRIVTEDGFIG